MKKVIGVAVVLLMVAALFAACGAPAAEQTDGGPDVVNPLKEYDGVEALADATGIEMQLPHSAELVLVQSIDDKMNEVVFTVADGSEYTYRKAKSDFPDTNGENDISGMYVEWKDVHEGTTPNGLKVTVKTGDPDNDGAGLVIWNDGTYKYAIIANKGYDEGMLFAAADSVR